MTAKLAPAKTPTVAIARILRGFGLTQGKDFRVKGQYRNGERVGTYVAVLTTRGDRIIAESADMIEHLSHESGFPFGVSIHYTASGRLWTWVANYGGRVREAVPANEHPASAPVAEETRVAVKRIEQRPGRKATPVVTAQAPATRTVDDARVNFPKGTVVQGKDSSGLTRTGIVNGIEWGQVTVPGHPNYGRTWVDVDWFAVPGDMGCGRRGRPFTDTLTVIR